MYKTKVRVMKSDFSEDIRDCNVMRHIPGVGYQLRLDDGQVITARDELVTREYPDSAVDALSSSEEGEFVKKVFIFCFVVCPVFLIVIGKILITIVEGVR